METRDIKEENRATSKETPVNSGENPASSQGRWET